MSDEAKQQLAAAIRKDERAFWVAVFQTASRGYDREVARVGDTLWTVAELMEEGR